MRLALGLYLLLLTAAPVAEPQLTLLAYLGGSGIDDCDGIAFDRNGDIYVACQSDSPDFPGLPGKSAAQFRDPMDALIVRISRRQAMPYSLTLVVRIATCSCSNWIRTARLFIRPF